jgi:HEAT repeat protein
VTGRKVDWAGVRRAREASERGDLEALVACIDDGDSAVRGIAVRSLGLLGDSRGVPVLVRTLNSADEGLRVVAVKALGRIGHEDGVPALRRVVRESDDFGLRTEAMIALVRSGDRTAVAPIAGLLTRPDLEHELRNEPVFPHASIRSTKRWARRVLRQEQAVEAVELLEGKLSSQKGLDRWRMRRLIRQLKRTSSK